MCLDSVMRDYRGRPALLGSDVIYSGSVKGGVSG